MSLKGDKYETAEEVRTRLEGTVVLYENEPVYITRVSDTDKAGEKARVFFRQLPVEDRQEETRKYLSSRKFDLSPFRMGFINFQGNAYYLFRMPGRQYKQGLCRANLGVSPVVVGNLVPFNFGQLVYTTEFVNMINGVYPSFNDLNRLYHKADEQSTALSRSFAVVFDRDFECFYLYHKNTKCGMCFKDDRSFYIPNKFRFLKEELEQCNIPINFK